MVENMDMASAGGEGEAVRYELPWRSIGYIFATAIDSLSVNLAFSVGSSSLGRRWLGSGRRSLGRKMGKYNLVLPMPNIPVAGFASVVGVV
jgi:hypothetical protein